MTNDTEDWRDDLWRRYAFLFVPSAPFASGIWSLPDGWRDIVERLLHGIMEILSANGASVTIESLHARRGTLEVAWRAEDARARILVGKRIDRFAARAACSCEVCGAAAERYAVADDVAARCAVHRPRGVPPVLPRWPLIRIDRVIEAGVSGISRCRIYDRASDSWVEVDPEALGIPRSP